MPATTKTLSAQNTFTDAIHIIGDFNLSISTDGRTWLGNHALCQVKRNRRIEP